MNNPLRYVHSWPTVAIVAVVCAFVGVIFHFADAEGKASLLGVLCVLGTTVAAIARHAFAVPKDKPPTRLDDDNDDPGEGGEVLAEEPPTKPLPRTPRRVTLSPRAAVKDSLTARFRRPFVLLTAAFVLALSVPFFVTGCSPSALQTHATIGTVASVTVRSLAPVVPSACSAALTSCADDACIVRVTGDCRTAALAYEGARDSVHFYLSAVEVAALADEGSVLPALREALVGLAEFWSRLRDGLALLGVSLPALPPAAAGLIVGAL